MATYIFTLLGTGGDVLPGLVVAKALKARGHKVTILTYDYFADEIANAGLSFYSVGTSETYLSQVTTASFWERNGTSKGLDENGYLRLAFKPVYDYIIANREGNPFLVCTRNAYGARFAAERYDLPILCLAYCSTQFASAERMPYCVPMYRRMPLFIRKLSMAMGDRLYNQPLVPKVNELRRLAGLEGIENMREWSFFGTPSLALYPAWYDDVSDLGAYGVIQADFVFAHVDERSDLQAELDDFLGSGGPPIVFTFGTGVAHVRIVFEKAIEVLRQLDMRGVFVSKFAQNLPQHDEANLLAVEYANFATLLPRVACLVHHGGIGTAAQALRAGIPQVIVPLAFDQPDNAYRFKALGLGEFVSGMDFKVKELQKAVTMALTGIPKTRLAEIRQKLLSSSGGEEAADLCERYFNGSCDHGTQASVSNSTVQ